MPYDKEYYEANKARILETQRKYKKSKGIKENPETKLARNRKWREANREKEKERHRNYHKNNPGKAKIKKQIRSLRITGFYTKQEWDDLLQKYNYMCLSCGSTEDICADHIIPLSKGGLNTIDNIQPLCRVCNSKKGTKNTDYRNI